MSDAAATVSGWPSGRVGYVALLGRPNVGKSTLLNTAMGTHLAPVSRLPQTTRRNCLGIVSDAASQILFVDAPGVHVPHDGLDHAMERSITRALKDADVVLCLADSSRAPGVEDRLVAEAAARSAGPVLLVLTKADICDDAQLRTAEEFYRGIIGPIPPVFRVCALRLESVAPVLEAIKSQLPEGPFHYDPEQLTDQSEREIGAELIREACLESLREEVPHALAVAIDTWKVSEKNTAVNATLHVEHQSQKKIVVGKGGQMVTHIGHLAEKKLSELCGVRVKVRLWVKVSPAWRDKQHWLKEFGVLD